MNIRSKVFVLFMLTVSLIIICFSFSLAQNQFKLAALYSGTCEYYSAEIRGMEKAAKDLGVEIVYADAEWDAARQLAQVENFVAKGVDAIMLTTVDNIALIPAVKVCNDANVPLITFCNCIGDDETGIYPGVESFIGKYEFRAGQLLGSMAEELLGDEESNIILIEGNPGTPPQRMREKAFLQVADQHPNWNIVGKRLIVDWTVEGSLTYTEAVLQSGKDVDLISAQWWGGALGAAMACEQAGIDNIHITGTEFAKQMIPYIKSGLIDMTTYFSIEEEGYKAVDITVKFLKGEEVPKTIETKHTIVTKDNVDQFEPEI